MRDIDSIYNDNVDDRASLDKPNKAKKIGGVDKTGDGEPFRKTTASASKSSEFRKSTRLTFRKSDNISL